MPATLIQTAYSRTVAVPVMPKTRMPKLPSRGRMPILDAGEKRRQKPGLPQVPVQNRIRVLLVHIPIYSIRGQARLAHDAGVSRSTISRLVNGRINPSYCLARAATDALERCLGRPLDIRDVFSTDGTYLTASGCALCQCGGCLPEEAWSEDGTLKSQWRDARPGDWSRSPQISNPPMPNIPMPSPQTPMPPHTPPQPTGQPF